VFFWPDALRPGKNVIAASDGMGHGHTMTVYFRGGAAGVLPATREPRSPTSRPATAAYFIDTPIHEQWPFYAELAGTADNTFDVLPEAVAGASWIATRRQSDDARTTGLAFDVSAAAELFVMFTRQASAPAWITAAGFTDTGASGVWRDNSLALVPYALYHRSAAAGTHIDLAATPLDYVVLVK
jgi:hypothetical protein